MNFESYYRKTFKQDYSEHSKRHNEDAAPEANIGAPGPVPKAEKYRRQTSTYESQEEQASSAAESVEATNLLIDQALEKTAEMERELDRALSEAKEDVYKRASLFIETDELPFWHFADFVNAINTLSIWKEYIPLERYEACAEKLRIHSAAATRIMRQYSELWAPNHEPPRLTKEKLFTMLANLRNIDPDDFPADLINITDDEFKELGSGGMMLRDPLPNFQRTKLLEPLYCLHFQQVQTYYLCVLLPALAF